MKLHICATLLLSTPFCLSEDAPTTGIGQLGTPVSWIPVSGAKDEFYMGQVSRDGRLILTPNESFFPKLGLTATGTGTVSDIDHLNGGKSFSAIEKWDTEDVAEWGILTKSAGNVTLRIWFSSQDTTARFRVQVGNDVQEFGMLRPGGQPELAAQLVFRVPTAGRHSVKLTCVTPGTKTAFHWMELAGPSIREAAVLRKRWRPAAAHTKFSSSQANGRVRMWVMEMDAVPGDLGFYCPITTPFGYYGPTWQANGIVNKGFNFSLWSYGRGSSEPPVHQLSHLLAIGDSNAEFGGFGHEGTGVKIRGWEPLEGRQGQRQTIALRVQPGPIYDKYVSYFYDNNEQRWRLFGVGNKYNKKKPITNLWVGSFVEVPGPPPVQRTGPYERTMRYRGWVMDDNGQWSQLDRMTSGDINRTTGLTYTDRGINDEGWFYMQTGGWTFRKSSKAKTVELEESSIASTLPEYLTPKDIEFLTSETETVQATVQRRGGGRIVGTFNVGSVDPATSMTMFWGSKEGLTFAEKWEHQNQISAIQKGDNSFQIDGVTDDDTVYVRFLLRNHQGQFWSNDTLVVRP